MPANKNLLVDAAIILALLLVGAAGYWFSPLLLPKSDVTANPDAGCDLHRQACGATLPGGGRVELAITPQPIPTLRPFDIEVRVAGVEAKKAALDLAGATMNMGYNRADLTASGAGRFAGSASLPVCVSGAMSWRATVLLETDRQRIAVPFRFDSPPH
ncbi:MAG: hypothetical protein PHY45_09155 [Rhodocyclaceae bacterium]|nr:hypothetical protein [Rhodocyclaceae bacterium]